MTSRDPPPDPVGHDDDHLHATASPADQVTDKQVCTAGTRSPASRALVVERPGSTPALCVPAIRGGQGGGNTSCVPCSSRTGRRCPRGSRTVGDVDAAAPTASEVDERALSRTWCPKHRRASEGLLPPRWDFACSRRWISR